MTSRAILPFKFSITTGPRKYLSVTLGSGRFALDLLKVCEVVCLHATSAPVAHRGSAEGVTFTLRSGIAAVIDLRARFDLPAKISPRACIVVVRAQLPADSVVQIGLIVDGVSDVLDIDPSEICPVQGVGGTIRADLCLGCILADTTITTLLDIDRIVAAETAHAMLRVG